MHKHASMRTHVYIYYNSNMLAEMNSIAHNNEIYLVSAHSDQIDLHALHTRNYRE